VTRFAVKNYFENTVFPSRLNDIIAATIIISIKVVIAL